MAREGARAEVSTGWRIPIPTSTKAADAPPGGEAVTSYSYQDIGVSTWIESQISDQGDVFAHGRIEISSVEPAAKAMSGPITAPTVAAFSQKFGVVLKDGVEMTLAEAPGRDGGSLRLTMSASIER
jgi:type II secretory pathway component GspD/PulD (secretin)